MLFHTHLPTKLKANNVNKDWFNLKVTPLRKHIQGPISNKYLYIKIEILKVGSHAQSFDSLIKSTILWLVLRRVELYENLLYFILYGFIKYK